MDTKKREKETLSFPFPLPGPINQHHHHPSISNNKSRKIKVLVFVSVPPPFLDSEREREREREGMSGTAEKALSCLGRGFDITCDFRLKFCKGRRSLVLLNQIDTRDITIPGFGEFKDVSIDINCDKGDRIRYQSDVLQFNQMSELLNRKSSIPGKIPTGFFNSMFGFDSSSWAAEASQTKHLAMDGYFITLFNLNINRYPLLLCDEVIHAVPSSWEPAALARFIENYGTHIIVGLGIGGMDVAFAKQNKSSDLPSTELKKHLENLGDQLFTGACSLSPLHWKNKEFKQKVPKAFDVFDRQKLRLGSFSSITSKDGITVICSKRGGDVTLNSHCEWILTVPEMPDAINFSFIPITSLLNAAPGKGLLSHAINLYLRYKPPIDDLEYFLDFQSHKIWAPIHSDLPLGPTSNRAVPTPALQFNLIGPKLYVNTSQVTVGRRPVTGMRLYLEGKNCNRLAVHLEHLTNISAAAENRIREMSTWQGSDVEDERYFEAVQWKKFSHVCTATVKYDPRWATAKQSSTVVYVVTGAQLVVKEHESKSVLHLSLLFSAVSNSVINRSVWAQGSPDFSHKLSTSFFSTSFSGNPEREKRQTIVIDSGVFNDGPPVPVITQKLLKVVDTSHVCKGPLDTPGHWLVTAAKLNLDKGKICLHVKFSLLNYSSS